MRRGRERSGGCGGRDVILAGSEAATTRSGPAMQRHTAEYTDERREGGAAPGAGRDEGRWEQRWGGEVERGGGERGSAGCGGEAYIIHS